MRSLRLSAVILIVSSLLVSFSSKAEEKAMPVAKMGMLDLSGWDIYEDGPVNLDGEWEIYWNQLLDPQELRENAGQLTGYFYAPGRFNDAVVNGTHLTSFGYATFRLIVYSDSDQILHMLKIMEMMSAYCLFLDGNLVAHNGKVGKTREEMIPEYYQQTPPVMFSKGRHELVIQISNFNHRSGGFTDNIVLGEHRRMQADHLARIGVDIFLYGSLLIMALYHIGFYFFRRREISALYFGIFVLIMSFRIIITSEQILSVFFPQISFNVCYLIEYFTMVGAPIMFVVFFRSLFPKEVHKLFFIIAVGFSVAESLLILLTPTYIYTLSAPYYELFILAGIIYLIIAIVRTIIKKREGAVLVLIGILILFIGTLNDILYVNSILKIIELAPYGIFVFILIQSFVLSMRFTRTFNENEKLNRELEYHNKNLEVLVEERTHEITQQKEELLAQAEELHTINDELHTVNYELEKLSIVASETDNAVIIADNVGEIEWVNKGFTKLYGYTYHSFVEVYGGSLVEASDNELFMLAMTDCLERKESVYYSKLTPTMAGEKIWVHTTLTPIFDMDGNLKKLVLIDSNITKLKLAEEEIKNKNSQITKSINYAKLIQEALLPSRSLIKSHFPNAFILYKPKDIVSGDFYWFAEIDDKLLIATVDCTGHGVPGAFMSMIGNTLLNEIVKNRKITKPSEILFELNKGVEGALMQSTSGDSQRDDGMDMTICCINKTEGTATFACANHYAYLIENNEITIVRGDMFSIGGDTRLFESPNFTDHTHLLNEDSAIYMFTDGYIDQFGGPKNRKYMAKGLKTLIEKNMNLSMAEQGDLLDATFIDWKGSNMQIDDVLIIGFKIGFPKSDR